jgi:hypothetical protein
MQRTLPARRLFLRSAGASRRARRTEGLETAEVARHRLGPRGGARWLRRFALGACALIALIYVSTPGCVWYARSATTGHEHAVQVGCGAGIVSLEWLIVKWINFPWGPAGHFWHSAYRFTWLPSYAWSYEGVEVKLPLWIPLLLFAAIALCARVRRGQAISGRCGHCGYDLTGNVSGRCPECGTPARGPSKEDGGPSGAGG